MKRLAQIAATILATAGVLLALWQMREAVQLLVVALALASSVEPAVQRLVARGVARNTAVSMAFVALVGTLGLVVMFFGSLAAAEVSDLAERLPRWYDQVRATLLTGANWAQVVGAALPTADQLAVSLGRQQRDIGSAVLAVLGTLGALATLVISALTLGLYWLLDRQRIERLWLSLLPLEARAAVRATWTQVYDEVGLYVRGEAVVVALTSLALLSIYTLLDVPGAALLALLGGLAQIVPLLGPPIALGLGVVAGFSQGTLSGTLVLVGVLYVLGVVRLVIARRIFQAGVTVNPVLVIVLFIALFELGGPWSVLLAPPLAAAIQTAVRAFTNEQRATRPIESVGVAALQERLAEIEAVVVAERADDPRVVDLLGRARRLVDEAAGALPHNEVLASREATALP
jgi:predicted PurR-regulated permease PerM